MDISEEITGEVWGQPIIGWYMAESPGEVYFIPREGKAGKKAREVGEIHFANVSGKGFLPPYPYHKVDRERTTARLFRITKRLYDDWLAMKEEEDADA